MSRNTSPANLAGAEVTICSDDENDLVTKTSLIHA